MGTKKEVQKKNWLFNDDVNNTVSWSFQHPHVEYKTHFLFPIFPDRKKIRNKNEKKIEQIAMNHRHS